MDTVNNVLVVNVVALLHLTIILSKIKHKLGSLKILKKIRQNFCWFNLSLSKFLGTFFLLFLFLKNM